MRATPCILLTALVISTASAQTANQATRSRTATTSAPDSTTAAKPAATPAVSAPCNCYDIQAQRHLPAYTAKQETTRAQTLSDGTTVKHVDDEFIARDADGRMRTEMIRTLQDGTVTHSFNVTDPVKGVRFNWTTGYPSASHTVYVYSLHPTPRPATLAPTPAVVPSARRYTPLRTESLPPQTIAGLYAEGFLRTTTTPAGYDGNDRDIVVTDETWTSPELGIMVRRVYNDPRTGKNTTELTDIQRTDPDPTLFNMPEGFTIRDVNSQ